MYLFSTTSQVPSSCNMREKLVISTADISKSWPLTPEQSKWVKIALQVKGKIWIFWWTVTLKDRLHSCHISRDKCGQTSEGKHILKYENKQICLLIFFGGKRKQTGAPHLIVPVTKLHTKRMLQTEKESEVILEESCVINLELGLGYNTELKPHNPNIAVTNICQADFVTSSLLATSNKKNENQIQIL